MRKLDMAKVRDGVKFELEENAPKRPGESDQDAAKRFAGLKPWVKLALQHGGANKRYNQRLEALQKPFRRSIQLGTISDEKAESIILQAFVECILIEWGNIDIPGAMPFTAEGAKAILAEPEWALFYGELRQLAQDQTDFMQIETEADAKN